MTKACPVCRQPVPLPASGQPLPTYFPFCSERCRMVDLGRWFNEDYKVSRQADDEEADEG